MKRGAGSNLEPSVETPDSEGGDVCALVSVSSQSSSQGDLVDFNVSVVGAGGGRPGSVTELGTVVVLLL